MEGSPRFGRRDRPERMKKNPRNDEDERSEDAPVVAEPESFGTWLRRQREVREIDLREIADSSKVGMSYLQAFEEDRFDVLPSPVFAKGFLRQYARYVGLDPEEVVNFYLAARHPEGEAEPDLQPRTSPEAQSSKYLYLALILVAALVLLVGLLSTYGDRLGSLMAPSSAKPEPAQSQVEEPSATADAADGVVATGGAPSTGGVSSTSGVGSGDSAGTGDRVFAGAPHSEVADSAGENPPIASQANAVPGLPVRVTLDFMSDCWVEASVDGVKELSELKVQGESLLLAAKEVVEFKVGDVGAVQVEVNGVPFEIENNDGKAVRTVRIDLETIAGVKAGRTAVSRSSDPGSIPTNEAGR